MPSRFRRRMAGSGPRILSILWSGFALVTAIGYSFTSSPPPLKEIDAILPLPIWSVWAIAGLVLAAGGLVPRRSGEKALRAARWMRGIGLWIVTILLAWWVIGFLSEDPVRWFTSAKNYIFLAALALVTAWYIARETTTPIREAVTPIDDH